jgi:hypothetical protein
VGWTPRTLAAFTGANTTGVRSLYAVLTARLSRAELPPPHGQHPARPPWCGQSDEVTRMLDSTATRRVRARAACGLPQGVSRLSRVGPYTRSLFYTKLHNRLLRPLLARRPAQAPPALRHALRAIDQHIDDYITQARHGKAA